jgi:predicted N-acyltransferase
MRFKIVDSIHDLDAERWDALAGTELTMTHRWHRVMEASRVAYQPRYLLAEDRAGPLTAIVAERFPSFGGSGWRDLLLRRLTLIVSAPYSSRHCGIALRPGASPEYVDRLLQRLAWHERRPLLGVANVDSADLASWTQRRYHPRRQPPRMVLDLESPSYEQYLQSLPARARQELRRTRRHAAEADVLVRQIPLDGCAADLYPLLAEVAHRHRSLVFSPEIFSALARELDDRTLVLAASANGRSAGFFLCLQEGTSLMAIIAGLRYALAYPTSAYFVLLDELVRWSLEHGIKRIYAGLSNEAQKQRHGFSPRARWLCVRAYPRPLNTLLGRRQSGAQNDGALSAAFLAPTVAEVRPTATSAATGLSAELLSRVA